MLTKDRPRHGPRTAHHDHTRGPRRARVIDASSLRCARQHAPCSHHAPPERRAPPRGLSLRPPVDGCRCPHWLSPCPRRAVETALRAPVMNSALPEPSAEQADRARAAMRERSGKAALD
jgi:hypothetical protein